MKLDDNDDAIQYGPNEDRFLMDRFDFFTLFLSSVSIYHLLWSSMKIPVDQDSKVRIGMAICFYH